MKTYFTWVLPGESYDPLKHSREDVCVFRLEIQEKEGTYPCATVLIKGDPEFFTPQREEALISANNKVLFRGRLLKAPLKMEEHLMEIRLSARPPNAQDLIQGLCQKFKKNPLYDPLFMIDPENPKGHEVLAPQSRLFYWSRTSFKPKLSSIFQGSRSVTLQSGCLPFEDIRYRWVHVPLESVDVEVTAEWVQECQGQQDIGYLIGRCFEGGMINTLTGKGLKKNWWSEGHVVARSGYVVQRSILQNVTPPSTEPFNLYPRYSQTLWEPEGTEPRPYRLKRSWFKVKTLELGWHYRQKRRETIHFHLRSALQPLALQGKRKKIRLLLNHIASQERALPWLSKRTYPKGVRVFHKGHSYMCLASHKAGKVFKEDRWLDITGKEDPVLRSASFFKTERGKQAVMTAVEIAKAHLAYSARCMEVQCILPLSQAMDLTCHHDVTLYDARLPHGWSRGKVKRLKLYQDGETGNAWGEVVLACALGNNAKDSLETPAQFHYVEENYMQGGYVEGSESILTTPSRITLRGWTSVEPLKGLVYGEGMSAEDMVEDIQVIHPVVEQEKALRPLKFSGKKAVEQTLKSMQTGLKIRLKDLRSTGVLWHRIHIDAVSPYEPPQGIQI